MITHRKEVYFVPAVLLLKALVDKSDYQIYQALIKGCENDSFYKGMLPLLNPNYIVAYCQNY